MKKTILTLCLLVAVPLAALAEEEGELSSLPIPPQLPPQVQTGEVLEPEVTISETSRGTVHRYSVNGKIYMVKVVPAAGPPYYFLDSDGV